MNNRLGGLLKKHEAYWSRDSGSVLLNRAPERVFRNKPYPKSDGSEIINPTRISAEDVDLQRFVGAIASAQAESPAIGDLFGYVGPVYPEAWMEAIIGCEVHASAFGCTAKPIVGGTIEEIAAAANNAVGSHAASPWYHRLKEMLVAAGTFAESMNFAVRFPHLRGVVDMVAAFIGEERLCVETFDHPDELSAVAEIFADLWISVAQTSREVRSSWNGGYLSSWKLFSTQNLIDYQIDATSILSPETYRDIFLAADRRIFDSFPASVIHLHSVGLHTLRYVLETNVSVVEINIDREAGWWDQSLIKKYCEMIQQAGKALLLVGEMSDAEIADLMNSLDHRGLAIDSWERTVTET